MFFLTTISLISSEKLDDYIVMFHTPSTLEFDHEQRVYANNMMRTQSYLNKNEKIVKTFTNGYIANMTDGTKKRLERDKAVAIVEKDQEINVNEVIEFKMEPMLVRQQIKSKKISIQDNAPWGIRRISSGKSFTENSKYQYPSSAGEGVDVYVIDSGVETDHPELNGAAKWGANFVDDTPDIDEHGHGTHCAGIIAGKRMGIAKNANVIAVKVLDKFGSGKISRVILGVDFVIRNHLQKMDKLNFLNKKRILEHEMENFEGVIGDFLSGGNHFLKSLAKFLKIQEQKPKTVINMSVGGMKSRALEFAVNYGTKIGIHFSVAAGNDHEDACLFSPGSAYGALTVGASTKYDKIAFFSNIGRCVDIYAPGMQIKSSWKGHSMKIASGTSMAAPHVSGAMALYLGERNYTPDELKDKILEDGYDVVESDDEDDEDMLDFWPIKYLFGNDNKLYKLLSIYNLNDSIEGNDEQ